MGPNRRHRKPQREHRFIEFRRPMPIRDHSYGHDIDRQYEFETDYDTYRYYDSDSHYEFERDYDSNKDRPMKRMSPKGDHQKKEA